MGSWSPKRLPPVCGLRRPASLKRSICLAKGWRPSTAGNSPGILEADSTDSQPGAMVPEMHFYGCTSTKSQKYASLLKRA